jgi:hypothetical protein
MGCYYKGCKDQKSVMSGGYGGHGGHGGHGVHG